MDGNSKNGGKIEKKWRENWVSWALRAVYTSDVLLPKTQATAEAYLRLNINQKSNSNSITSKLFLSVFFETTVQNIKGPKVQHIFHNVIEHSGPIKSYSNVKRIQFTRKMLVLMKSVQKGSNKKHDLKCIFLCKKLFCLFCQSCPLKAHFCTM